MRSCRVFRDQILLFNLSMLFYFSLQDKEENRTETFFIHQPVSRLTVLDIQSC